MYQDESWRILPPNARKRSTVPFPEPEMLGNEALGAVLMHILEKTLEKLLISEVLALSQCPNFPIPPVGWTHE